MAVFVMATYRIRYIVGGACSQHDPLVLVSSVSLSIFQMTLETSHINRMGGDGDIGDVGPIYVYPDMHFKYRVVLHLQFLWIVSPHAANVYALVQWQNMAVHNVNNVKIGKGQYPRKFQP